MLGRSEKRSTDIIGFSTAEPNACVDPGSVTELTTPRYASAVARFVFVSNTRKLCHKPQRECKL